MRINYKNLKKLIVETKLGIKLGSVKDIVLDTDGQNILQYEVGGLVGKKYLVSREQVLSIDSEKVMVEDSVLKIKNKVEIGQISSEIEPVTMCESEN
ncbi:MAG TPA: hypothetical protein DEB09_03200 [Candidatus Magasanikbacteria bacterium]|nr:hypothetical protein [Candidatus Magasanikbacteria bacterium]